MIIAAIDAHKKLNPHAILFVNAESFPKKHINKTYFAKICGKVLNKHIKLFEEGVVIDDGYKTLPSRLEILKPKLEILKPSLEINFYSGRRKFFP